jgi:hypothetical protein
MVILVPVIAGDSTIPKWVLDYVPSSRDRAGFSRQLRQSGISIVLVVILCCVGMVNWLLLTRTGPINHQRILVPLLILFSFGALGGFGHLRVRRARNWIDQNNKWLEVSKLRWQQPPGDIFSPKVVGNTKIPKWVLAQITHSQDRVGLSREIDRRWSGLISFSILFFLYILGNIWGWLYTSVDRNTFTVFPILISPMWFLGIWKFLAAQRARIWLDQNKKWLEIARLEWQGPPQPRS